jgi:hypothetical protein
MWANFKSMPTLLKYITAHSFACFAFLIGSALPGHTFAIKDRVVSYSEWWSSGAGIGATALGILMPVAGVFLVKKAPYARPAYLAVLSLGMIAPYPILGQPELALVGALFIAMVALYLYVRQPVQWYFASNRLLQPSDAPSARRG